jgi:hypothetical protein
VIHTLLSAALKIACDHDTDFLVTTTGRWAIRHVFWQLGFESRARSAPAVVIHPPHDIDTVNLKAPPLEPLDDHLDFWHGDVF